jgi:pyruvate dehydrogenase E1 component beta subunit
MFGGDYPVPLVIRVAIGRQWGNGPQHTGGFLSLFGSTPGLRVVVPSSPNQAYQLMLSAVRDNNPVIFLEPRWLYGLSGNIEVHDSKVPLDKCRLVRSGTDLTLVSYGDGLLAAYKAAEEVSKYGIEAEVIDLVSINPLDYKGVIESLKKTQRLVTVDTTSSAFSVGSEIISKVTSSDEVVLKTRPIQLACPDVPCPTAPSLTKNYYPTWPMVANSVLTLFNLPNISEEQTFEELNLAPKVECPYA